MADSATHKMDSVFVKTVLPDQIVLLRHALMNVLDMDNAI